MSIKLTRYHSISNKDLSDWTVWYDANKNRYHDTYEVLTFWHTLDAKAVAFTFKLPHILGTRLRILLALLGSNRFEPFPIANNDAITYKWENNPDWLRWLRWHIRNPWSDLRKFYLGFGYAVFADNEQKGWGHIRWAHFKSLSFPIPFPVIETKWFKIGWKQRGILTGDPQL